MIRSANRILARLLQDECGAAVTEYAVVIGLVIMGVIAVLLQFGPRLLERWGLVAQRIGGEGSTVTGVTAQTPGSHAS